MQQTLENFKNKNVAIWVAGPDPDAIGSAMGLQWLLRKYGATAGIWFSGVVSHAQNRTMVNLLNVTLHNFTEWEQNKDDYDKIFCVDCTPKNLPIESVDIIIDHHPKNLESEDGYELVDMRSTGSCASILYDWIKEADMLNSLEDEEGAVVASALLLGVFNDTDSLTSEDIQPLDFEAYQVLHKYCDVVKVKSVLAYPLPRYFLEAEAESMKPENTEIINTTFISCVGYVPASRRDILAQLSDKYARLEGISTAIVFAVVDGFLEGCCRSSDVSLNLHEFTQKIFGKEFSGGKFSKSAGKVPLGFLSVDDNADEDIKAKVMEAVKAKVLTLIKKEVG